MYINPVFTGLYKKSPKYVAKNAGRVFTKMTEVTGDVCIIGVQRN